MKLANMISKVLAKAAPMSATESEDIDHKMNLWFEQMQDKVKAKETAGETLTMLEKGIKLLDEWYMRALFAMSYIWLVRVIQDWMNPGDDKDLEELDHR